MKRGLILSIVSASAMTKMAGDAKYIFYFIGNGIGMGHVNAAEIYNIKKAAGLK